MFCVRHSLIFVAGRLPRINPKTNTMKLYVSLLALLIFSAACKQGKQQNEETASTEKQKKATVTLEKKWETTPVLLTCESVLYSEDDDLLYVANINGAHDGKDGNGFISKVSLDGRVTDEKWATGLDAPKGMGLLNGKLYVADLTQVREIDTKTGKVTNNFPAAGAKFLNDIAVNNGKVYISDSRGGTIYVIEDNKIAVWMQNLDGPNGLFGDGGNLVVALWNARTINTVDISSKEITLRTEGIENPDGIEAIDNNEYLVSSWNGMVHHIDGDWKKTLVLDTRQDSVNAADIAYVKSRNLLLIPTFFKNKVVAYEVVR